MADNGGGIKVVADNRQARYLYEILETLEAGIELKGTEVKSVRQGKANLKDGYANIRDAEIWLQNVHISPHETASQVFNHDPRRPRRLLLHKAEIRRLIGKVQQKGLTLVPLRLYLKGGRVKVAIALVRGKKVYDKREDLKQKQAKREIERTLKTL